MGSQQTSLVRWWVIEEDMSGWGSDCCCRRQSSGAARAAAIEKGERRRNCQDCQHCQLLVLKLHRCDPDKMTCRLLRRAEDGRVEERRRGIVHRRAEDEDGIDSAVVAVAAGAMAIAGSVANRPLIDDCGLMWEDVRLVKRGVFSLLAIGRSTAATGERSSI